MTNGGVFGCDRGSDRLNLKQCNQLNAELNTHSIFKRMFQKQYKHNSKMEESRKVIIISTICMAP